MEASQVQSEVIRLARDDVMPWLSDYQRAEIKLDSLLLEDLHFDELGVVELIFAIEDFF